MRLEGIEVMATLAKAAKDVTDTDYIGRSVLRREDDRLLSGNGRFTEDIALHGLTHASFVRSREAHAHIRSIDTREARGAPGVVAVLTAQDLGDELPAIPTDWILPVMTHIPTRYALAKDRVRFFGEALAIVVAKTRAQADDAAALVNVVYDTLPVVVESEAALREGAPLLHDDFPNNQAFVWHVGATHEAFEEAAKKADFVLTLRLENQRISAAPMECRAVLAEFDRSTQRLRLHTGTQNVHVVKRNLSRATGIPEHKVQVIAPDVGGGFGAKLCLYPEDALLAVVSRRIDRPVRWAETRSENFVGTSHGRDHVELVTVAANKDGKIVALKTVTYANVGAYISGMGAGIPAVFSLMVPGCYDIPIVSADVYGCLTNTTTTETYRGAGRPEAAYMIERTIEAVAEKLGMDPVRVRQLNFIPPEKFPHTTGVGFTLDSGDYAAALDMALGMLDYSAARMAQENARREGRLVGIGIGSYVEFCGFGDCTFLGFDRSAWEQVVIAVSRTGKVTVQVGTVPAGQGHDTTLGQIVAQDIGVPIDDVEIVFGDTDLAHYGTGTYNSRSISNAGSASAMAAKKIIEKARRVAAHMLEAEVADVVYERQLFYVTGDPTNRRFSFGEVSQAAIQGNDLPEGLEPSLKEMALYKPPNFTSPFGAHVAMVEVDPDTGSVNILRYIAVDDCGNIINPQLALGQIHGGIAQGIGQVMSEHITFDENGQPTSATFLEYGLPRAHQMPRMETGHTVTPTPYNLLGAKGVGESGIIGPPPAIVNAVLDALRPVGVKHIDMPLSPPRVWAAIQEARHDPCSI
jgi:carbon-monoxide dehydrogenase large subunit